MRFAAAISWDVDNATDATSNSIVNAAGGDKNAWQELTVKRFELAFELAWLVLRDYLLSSGFSQDQIRGPKYVIRKSFQEGIVRDGEVWMQALDCRNKAVHIYREEIMSDIELAIKGKGVTFKTEVGISGDLDDSELPFFCDVVNYHTINHLPFKQHIDTAGVTFYRHDSGW